MFQGTLYPTQKPAAEFLVNRRQCLLAWEQGCGKTVISLAASQKLFELGKAENALVLAPTSFAWQWEDAIHTFTDSEVVYAQAKKKATRTYKLPGLSSYYIVPWSLFLRDYDDICRVPWSIVIADEVQQISNVKAKTAQRLKRFNTVVKPPYKWGLTGTAISNHLEELHSIMYWVDPKFLPPWPFFDKTHIERDEFNVVTSYKDLVGLNDYLQYRMDRKTHKDLAGQLPKLVEKVHTIQPTQDYLDAQNTLVSLLDDLVTNITFDEEGNPETKRDPKVAKAFHAARVALQSERKLDYAANLSSEILLESKTNKLVVFSFHKDPLYRLADKLGPSNVEFFTGNQSPGQKRKAIQRFRNGEVRMLLCSNAGAAGLDLPFANYIIHLDVPFSHGVLDQRNKRITRLSSTHATAVINYLIVADSLELFYYYIVKNKHQLASAVLEGTGDTVVIRTESLRQFLKGNE